MTYTFEPPTAPLNPGILPTTKGVQRALFKYYGPYPVGTSIILDIEAQEYRTVVSPDQLTLEILDEFARENFGAGPNESGLGLTYFIGGHVYTISAGVAFGLTLSGYTVPGFGI